MQRQTKIILVTVTRQKESQDEREKPGGVLANVLDRTESVTRKCLKWNMYKQPKQAKFEQKFTFQTST